MVHESSPRVQCEVRWERDGVQMFVGAGEEGWAAGEVDCGEELQLVEWWAN